MRNIAFYRKAGFAILTLLIASVTWLMAVTYQNRNISNPNPLLHFAIQNHTAILLVLIGISIIYGFLWSTISYHALERRRKESRSILETVFMFLGEDERKVVQFLVDKKGETTQAEISRLPGMTRVKAFRSLQKMEGKNLVEIAAHGKLRKVKLKENIMGALLD